ncbi:MAG TPA: DUF2283 domain-containing protein [Chloroflexi bacterium]|nr:DUF2283 domain-containing protein [Chloroflexota bacterium]
MNKPRVYYDPQSDVLYLLIKEGEEERFVEVAEGINVELDETGQILGIEILGLSRVLRQVLGPERLATIAQEG